MGKTAKGEEQKIKDKIVEYHERGVCGRYGEHIPKHKRGSAGKGDRDRTIDMDRYRENYDKIDWSK